MPPSKVRRLMQPADIAKIRTFGSVSLSPDGTRVASR
jgi:hypothetical protein